MKNIILVLVLVSSLKAIESFQDQHCTERGGCYCDCSWATPATCGKDDQSCCYGCCCGTGPTPTPDPPGPSGTTPCALELDGGQSNSQISGNDRNQFLSSKGYGRARSVKKYNMLGGGLSFTMDLSKCKDKVNCNLYLVIPGTLGNNGYYCDNGGSAPTCIELDIFESDGHSLVAQTMHTKLGQGVGGCDTWGCRTLTYLNGQINGNAPIDCTVQFSNDGDVTIQYHQNGQTVTAFNNLSQYDGQAKSAIVEGMKNHGAIIVTGIWTGWVPPNDSTTGDLEGSALGISNLSVTGSEK